MIEIKYHKSLTILFWQVNIRGTLIKKDCGVIKQSCIHMGFCYWITLSVSIWPMLLILVKNNCWHVVHSCVLIQISFKFWNILKKLLSDSYKFSFWTQCLTSFGDLVDIPYNLKCLNLLYLMYQPNIWLISYQNNIFGKCTFCCINLNLVTLLIDVEFINDNN